MIVNNLVSYNNLYGFILFSILYKDYYYDDENNYYNQDENEYKDIGEYIDIYDDQWGDEIYDYDNDDYDNDYDDDDYYDDNYD